MHYISSNQKRIFSAIGSFSAYKLPEIGHWGFNKASDTKNYLNSKICFWGHSNTEKTIEIKPIMNTEKIDTQQNSTHI